MKKRITLQEVIMGIGYTLLLIGMFSLIGAGIIVKCNGPQTISNYYNNRNVARYLWQHKLFTGLCILSTVTGLGLSLYSEGMLENERKGKR